MTTWEGVRLDALAIYDAPHWYDIDYAGYRGEDAFYRLLLRALPTGHAFVEVGAGTGRLSIPYAREGHRVHAVEPAPAMRARLVEKAGTLAGLTVEDARLDVFAGPADAPVGIIAFPFNGLLHVTTREEMARGFAHVRTKLVPGGVFAVDLTGPSWDAMARGGLDWGRDDERVHPTTGVKVHTCDRSTYTPSTRRMRIDIRFVEAGSDHGVELCLEQTMWTWQEVLGALADAGFVVDMTFSDVDLSPFTERGPRLLVSARSPS